MVRSLRFKTNEKGESSCTIKVDGKKLRVIPTFTPSTRKSYFCTINIKGDTAMADLKHDDRSPIEIFQSKARRYQPTDMARKMVDAALHAGSSPRKKVLDILFSNISVKNVLAVLPNIHLLDTMKKVDVDIVPSKRHEGITTGAAATFGQSVHSVDFEKMMCPKDYDMAVLNLDERDEETKNLGKIVNKAKTIKTKNIVVIANRAFNEKRLKASLSSLGRMSKVVRYGDTYGFVVDTTE